MSRIDFYHLQKQSLDEVLPKLLSKAYESDNRIVVKTVSDERVTYLDGYLWTFNDESFLPHGCKKDGFVEQQPIFLTADNQNPNGATFLFLVDGATAESDELQNFERVFNLFDGNSEPALVQARAFWKACKEAGFEVYYWQQTATGKWEQKA